MKKQKMVTRTIKVTKYEVTYFDLEINEVRGDVLETVGTPTDKERRYKNEKGSYNKR